MDSSKAYHLEILTPLKTIFSGEVEYIIATGADGLFGVLVNHAPMLSGLGFGPLYVREAGGKEKWFTVSDGFFEIRGNKAALLVDTAEAKEEIDVKRAEAARERALQRLAEHQADIDVDRARAALHRAMSRINLAQR